MDETLQAACACVLGRPVDELTPVPRDYDDFGSDVWKLHAGGRPLALRASRMTDGLYGFWYALHALYGTDPRDMGALMTCYNTVAGAGGFAAPAIRGRFRHGGREHLLLDWVPGSPLPDCDRMDEEQLFRYGRSLGLTHAARLPGYGHPALPLRNGTGYHAHMARVITEMMDLFPDRAALYAPLAFSVLPEITALPPPDRFAWTMPDQSPGQYVADGEAIYIVDAETCVAAPPAMDLIALEQQMDAPRAEAFLKGYRSVAVLPPLAAVRRPYRALLLILEVQGVFEISAWMNAPAVFGD